MDIGILGAGTWGTALACVLSRNGHAVMVWSTSEERAAAYSRNRVHPHLPGIVLPNKIVFTADMQSACENKQFVFFAVPSVHIRSTAAKAAAFIRPSQAVVNAAKGIEAETLCTMTQVLEDEFRKVSVCPSLTALSGPSLALEVAQDLPTTIVAACRNLAAAEKVQEIFAGTCLRVYTNTDILGVELCGAFKNIIALATGISKGLGFGDNTRAALITRGMAEITRLGVAMGCQAPTFAGLAGMGDLIVTATSEHSRNNRAGQLIGAGMAPVQAVNEVGMVVEGINALPAAMQLARKYEVDMPILFGVNAMINGNADAAAVVHDLMDRDQKTELFPEK